MSHSYSGNLLLTVIGCGFETCPITDLIIQISMLMRGSVVTVYNL